MWNKIKYWFSNLKSNTTDKNKLLSCPECGVKSMHSEDSVCPWKEYEKEQIEWLKEYVEWHKEYEKEKIKLHKERCRNIKE